MSPITQHIPVLKATTSLSTATFSGGVFKNTYGIGEREITVEASNSDVDRMNDVVEAAGCTPPTGNCIVLANHDSAKPIGRAQFRVSGSKVLATITFPPLGVDAEADRWCALVKNGVVDSVSIGFNPIEAKPAKSGRGKIYTRWELCEISCVSIPANPGARVTGKTLEATITPAAPVAQRSGITGQGVAQTANEVTGMSLYEAEAQRRAAHCRKVADSAPPTRADRLLQAAKYRNIEDQLGCFKRDNGGGSYEYWAKGNRQT